MVLTVFLLLHSAARAHVSIEELATKTKKAFDDYQLNDVVRLSNDAYQFGCSESVLDNVSCACVFKYLAFAHHKKGIINRDNRRYRAATESLLSAARIYDKQKIYNNASDVYQELVRIYLDYDVPPYSNPSGENLDHAAHYNQESYRMRTEFEKISKGTSARKNQDERQWTLNLVGIHFNEGRVGYYKFQDDDWSMGRFKMAKNDLLALKDNYLDDPVIELMLANVYRFMGHLSKRMKERVAANDFFKLCLNVAGNLTDLDSRKKLTSDCQNSIY